MANIMLAFRKTTTDALTTISATTNALTHGAQAVSALSETGSLHAQHYRNVTKKRLSLTEQEYEDIAESQAKLKIATAILSIEDQLESDPRLAAIYDRISLKSTKQPGLSVAAE